MCKRQAVKDAPGRTLPAIGGGSYAKTGQYLAFVLFHRLGLMIPAKQIQHVVDGEMGVMSVERFSLFSRFAGNHRRAQDKIADM